jgi:hypothetical protein
MAEARHEQATNIAKAYGAVSRALAEQANAERIRIAQANFDANRLQVEEQAAQKSSELARTFQQHVGMARANAAWRGVGGGSVTAQERAMDAEAEVARRNIDINATNMIGALAAGSLVPIEDPILAQIEGTFEGIMIGAEFVSALEALEPDFRTQTTYVQTGLGYQPIQSMTSTPQQFNLADQFPELTAFLQGDPNARTE